MSKISLAALTLAALSLPLQADAAQFNPPQLDPKAEDGCWVRFFGEPGFGDPIGRLAGAMYVYSVEPPGLIGATSEPGFSKELVTFGPNRKVADLLAFGFPDQVASLKIICDRH